MSKGKAKDGQRGGAGDVPPASSVRGPAPGAATPRVLAVDGDPLVRQQIAKALGGKQMICDTASSIAELRRALSSGEYDVVVIDEQQRDGSGLDAVRDMTDAGGPVRVIVTSGRAELVGAVEAMRCGAADFLVKPFKPADLAARVEAALSTVRRIRDEQRRVDRLKRLCRRLSTERQEVSRQVDSLCNDLVTAYQELADQMGHASLAGEFSSLVRQELDVESLLRATLEYLLTKTGPTNAAVFLPTGNQDFSLGAYVNYDLEKDTADVLLDHLADSIAPRLQHDTELRRYTTSQQVAERLGDAAAWLGESNVITFACREGGDCLAVVALFRDKKTPFADELIPVLTVMRDIFGEQLARVVRIHHRHMPKDAWPGFDVEDDRGLAA